MSRKKIATVCLWLLFSGSAVGQKNAAEKITEAINKILYGEPCAVPSPSDYQIASEPEDGESVQGFWEQLRHLDRVQARARVARYPSCLAEQERKLNELRAELLRAQIEALKADQRRKKLEAQSKALKNVVRKFPTRNLYGDADYQIHLGLVLDFEDTRKLIEQCADLGRFEVLRSTLEIATDLEQLRATLESYRMEPSGIGEFHGCPSGMSGTGIVELIEAPKPRTFTEEDFQPRVFSEEDFADAPLEKEPARIIDGELYDARARNRSQGSSWYRVKVEFDGDEIIIHFRLGGRVHLTLDDEEIADPSEIHARDRDRGNRWTIDIEGLAE